MHFWVSTFSDGNLPWSIINDESKRARERVREIARISVVYQNKPMKNKFVRRRILCNFRLLLLWLLSYLLPSFYVYIEASQKNHQTSDCWAFVWILLQYSFRTLFFSLSRENTWRDVYAIFSSFSCCLVRQTARVNCLIFNKINANKIKSMEIECSASTNRTVYAIFFGWFWQAKKVLQLKMVNFSMASLVLPEQWNSCCFLRVLLPGWQR